MKTLHLQLSSGEWATANEQGFIARPAIGMPASGEWFLIGAFRVNNFGSTVERFTLEYILNHANEMQWRHKNGSVRIRILDRDHGTMRAWGHGTRVTVTEAVQA